MRHHIHDGSHVAGEGGKALGNGLLVADIRENGLEGRKSAAVSRGNVQAALGHQGEQTDGFQGDGFAAGVGSCDDHGIKIRAQADGNRNHGFGVNEWVTSLAQLHPALFVHDRLSGSHLIAELGFGEDHIQLHQQLIVYVNGAAISCGLGGQLCENPFNFLLFLQFQFPKGIVGIYCGHRLHEISRAGSRHVVHQTRHVVFAFALHRHHIPSLSDGNDGLPEELGIGRGGNHLLQAVPDFPGLNAHMPPDVRQGCGGGVGDFLFGKNRAENLIL